MDLSKSAEGPKTDSRRRSRVIVLWSRTARGGPAGPWKLLNNSRLLRALFSPLRRFMPILTFRRRGFVFRHADVRELLSRDEDFTIAEINAPSMDRVNGPFILGMDRGDQYSREKAILLKAVHPEDMDRIRTTVRATADQFVQMHQAEGRIDFVSELSRPTILHLVAEYFGVAGPDEVTMSRWMRTIFHETFLNVGSDAGVRSDAELSAEQFHAYADELIATRRNERDAGKSTPDDFLTRMINMQDVNETRLSDEGIRRNIGGVVVGAVETSSKAVTQAIDQLLDRPHELAGAHKAAVAHDMETVTAYVLEALRFNPINPTLARHVARPAVLAADTPRKHNMPKDGAVSAAVLSAMFDPEVFKDPASFRIDRNRNDYLHFGYGMHTCFGHQINLVQLPETAAAILRMNNLRRASGNEGKITYDGPFPDRLVLEFDAPITGETS